MSKAEALQFVGAMQAAIEAGDPAQVGALVNFEAVARKAMGGIRIGDSYRERFLKEMLEEQQSLASWGHGLVSEASAGTDYGLLRLQQLTNADPSKVRTYAIFRHKLSDVRLNYYNYELGRAADGHVQAVDIWDSASGNWMSTEWRRRFMPRVIEANPNLEIALKASEVALAKADDAIMALIADFGAQDHAAVLDKYDQLPEVVRSDKTLMLLRLASLRASRPAEFNLALEQFRKAYPRDMAGDIHGLDFHVSRKEYVEASHCALRMDQAIGGDAYLKSLAANFLIRADKVAEAKAVIAAALKLDPNMLELYLTAFQIAVEQNQIPEAIRWLEAMQKQFQEEPAGLETDRQYTALVKSNQFVQWRAKHPPPDVIAKSLIESPTPLTEIEVQRVTAALEKAAVVLDSAKLNGQVDWARVAAQAVSGLKLPDGLRRDVVKAAQRGGRGGFAPMVTAATREGGRYETVRCYQHQGKWHALMRLIRRDLWVDYHLLTMVRTHAGRPMISNVYDFATGQSFVSAQRESLINSQEAIATIQNKTVKMQMRDRARTLDRMLRQSRSQQPKDALATLRTLPESQRKNRTLLLKEMELAMQVGPDECEQVLARLRAAYPNDPATIYVTAHLYYLQTRPQEALDALGKLDKLIGGDLYLQLLMARQYVLMKDFTQARAAIQKAIDGGLATRDAYINMVVVAAQEMNAPVALEWLDALVAKFQTDFAEIGEVVAQVPDFFRSPEFAGWLKQHDRTLEEVTPIGFDPALAGDAQGGEPSADATPAAGSPTEAPADGSAPPAGDPAAAPSAPESPAGPDGGAPAAPEGGTAPPAESPPGESPPTESPPSEPAPAANPPPS
ncbi:MAG: tetratricopeptide repeat protein [Pirellulales bacterium]|nr:tetratricopeptide repeat protein [Pirellulales bacterium]